MDNEEVAHHKQMTDIVHSEGGKICMQILLMQHKMRVVWTRRKPLLQG